MASFIKHKQKIANKKLNLKKLGMRLFNTYVTTIFFYNCELWTRIKNKKTTLMFFKEIC